MRGTVKRTPKPEIPYLEHLMLVQSLRFIQRRTFTHRPAMNWSAFVLTSISSDTEPTIVLNFDTAKYIFNVGENTNRAFLQSRHNWKKTKAFFLTQLGTQRTGGLPGPFPENCSVSPSLNVSDSRSVDDVRGWWGYTTQSCWASRNTSSTRFHAHVSVPVRVSQISYPLF